MQQEIKERLTKNGLKATPQRIIIYSALLNSHAHPTAEMIFDAIKELHPSISLATVYKTLDSLLEAGLARKVKTEDDVLRFDGRLHRHNHLFCARTRRIIDFEDPELEALLKNYFTQKQIPGFEVSDYQLHIHGQLIENQIN